jgi:monothiol glutaredoxin
MNSIKDLIKETIDVNPIVLFMKGTMQFPQCGFSGGAIQLLKAVGAKDFSTINVLENTAMRQGIKDYSDWPTVPQLYINGEFIGGYDIMKEMFESGELKKILNT